VRNERDMRNWFKCVCKADKKRRFTLTWVEHAPGSTVGAPDLFIGFDGQHVAIELKRLVVKKDGSFKVKVQPSQPVWHKTQTAAGINAFFVLGGEFLGAEFMYLVHSSLKPWELSSISELIDLNAETGLCNLLREYATSLDYSLGKAMARNAELNGLVDELMAI